MRIFLCGDVMTGRGIDQALPYPCSPELHESYVRTAKDYVKLAERANGLLPLPLSCEYVWGDALAEWKLARPQARVVNLETSLTRRDAFEPKGINYRMSPENAVCLASAGVDICALANNHVLDWSEAGLADTLNVLKRLGIQTVGAGANQAEAEAPAIREIPRDGRLIVFACACASSGAPAHWAAGPHKPGISFLPSPSISAVDKIACRIDALRRARDVVIFSMHWGPNWGYAIPDDHRRFARALIDRAGVSIVHGHSSHHPMAMEVYKGRLILYGCGDFLNDYEGIARYEAFRGDLALMYFVDVEATSGRLEALTMTPLQMKRFRLSRPSASDVSWLRERMDRECAPFGARVGCGAGDRFTLSM